MSVLSWPALSAWPMSKWQRNGGGLLCGSAGLGRRWTNWGKDNEAGLMRQRGVVSGRRVWKMTVVAAVVNRTNGEGLDEVVIWSSMLYANCFELSG